MLLKGDFKTVYHRCLDGDWFCCKDFIYGYGGHPYHVTPEELDRLKATDDREWIESGESCGCGGC